MCLCTVWTRGSRSMYVLAVYMTSFVCVCLLTYFSNIV